MGNTRTLHLRMVGFYKNFRRLLSALENDYGNIIFNYAQGHLEPTYVLPINGILMYQHVHCDDFPPRAL